MIAEGVLAAENLALLGWWAYRRLHKPKAMVAVNVQRIAPLEQPIPPLDEDKPSKPAPVQFGARRRRRRRVLNTALPQEEWGGDDE